MENRNRNTAMVLIIAGLYLLIGNIFGFFAITAFIILLLGIYKIRLDGSKSGYIIIGIAALMLLSSNFIIIISIILIAFGYLLLTTKQLPKDHTYSKKQSLLESIKWDTQQWTLRNTSITSVIAEIHLDLSLSILEEQETTLILQGIVGNIEILIPDDIGIAIYTNIIIGQVDIIGEKETGLLNKTMWQSPYYATSEYKVNLIISYVVGDIKVRMI